MTVQTVVINSLQNKRVKAAIKLRQRRQRDRHHRLLIDGLREIHQALDAGVQLTEVFICPAWANVPPALHLRQRLAETNTPQLEVNEAVWQKLTYGDRRDGIAAVAVPPTFSLEGLELGEQAIVVVLEAVEKPGNLGAVVRTADAVGATAVIATDPATDLFNPNTVRASLGTVFRLPLVATTGAAALAWLHDHALRTYPAVVDAPRRYTQVDFTSSFALVLGSEADGLSPPWRTGNVIPISLPMLGAADSLNVSTTAAVVLYEALRQREPPPLS